MRYHELIDALRDAENPNVLDYIDDAVQMLEDLWGDLKASNARCETLRNMLAKYQDEIVPGYREMAEKAERERNAAVNDINEILSLTELCPILCEWCRWNEGCDGSKTPVWRGAAVSKEGRE